MPLPTSIDDAEEDLIAITGPSIVGVLTLVVDNGLNHIADNLGYATATVNGLGGFFVYAPSRP